eukprot:gene1358-4533_t
MDVPVAPYLSLAVSLVVLVILILRFFPSTSSSWYGVGFKGEELLDWGERYKVQQEGKYTSHVDFVCKYI